MVEKEKSLEDLINKIRSAKKFENLKELNSQLQKVKKENSDGFRRVCAEFSGVISKIVNDDVSLIEKEIGSALSQGDFGRAQDKAMSSFSVVFEETKSLEIYTEDASNLHKLIELKKNENLERIELNEYTACREKFSSIRRTQDKADIKGVVLMLNDFIARWSSPRSDEVTRVRDYLVAISGGVRATLIIVGGDFSAFDEPSDTPDVFVTVEDESGHEFLHTDVEDDKKSPNFNSSVQITWNIGTVLHFFCYDQDFINDDLIFHRWVRATGIFGYEELNKEISGEGCTLTLSIRPEQSLPECPWR